MRFRKFPNYRRRKQICVILTRLCQRYSSVPTSIKVGSPSLLTSELKAWKISKTGDSPMLDSAEAIIVDAPMERLADDISAMLPLLTNNGVLFTVELTLSAIEKRMMQKLLDSTSGWI